MRTTLLAAFAAVMAGSLFSAGAADCNPGMEKLVPALLRDASKDAGLCPENVFVFTDAGQLFRALGAQNPEQLATQVADRRAFVLGHQFPVYLRSDGELKEMFSLYQAGKERQFLLAFMASWLKHELVHVDGVDDEAVATAAEIRQVEKHGIAKNDPDYLRLQKRYADLQKSAKKGEGHVLAVALAPPPPPRRAVETVLPYKGEQPATTVVARLANE